MKKILVSFTLILVVTISLVAIDKFFGLVFSQWSYVVHMVAIAYLSMRISNWLENEIT